MIHIKQIESKSGSLCWTADDGMSVIGQIKVKTSIIPEIVLLEFEQPEIGDGLIKTAAGFFAVAGLRQVRFIVDSNKAKEAAITAGFFQTENGLIIDPAQVRRNCGKH